ncbi:MAG: hypothetical protein R3C45_09175 [Phycisphaerales bacterium]
MQTDFNGLNIGTLDGQTAVGTGMTGIWDSNSGVPDVFAGDLVAPAGTNFGLVQSVGNGPQKVRFDNAERQNGVDFATPLSGTVWGTFLVNTNNGGTAGIGINSVISFASLNGRPKILASGTDLMFFPADVENEDVVVTNVLPGAGDSLILFKMFHDGVTGFTIDIWANPDLTAALPTPLISSASASFSNIWPFNRIGVGGSRFATGLDSYIDFVSLSDGPNAYEEVTGVPLVESLDGDLNGDGFVGITDLNIVLGVWNQNVTPGDLLAGDPSGDGFVGIDDLNTVLGNWNAGVPPTASEAVPEPTTLTCLAIGSLLMMRHSRKD